MTNSFRGQESFDVAVWFGPLQCATYYESFHSNHQVYSKSEWKSRMSLDIMSKSNTTTKVAYDFAFITRSSYIAGNSTMGTMSVIVHHFLLGSVYAIAGARGHL